MAKHGQSFVEFLIAIFLFLGVVSALFITSSVRIKGEVEKIQAQDSILKANLMATLALRESGPLNLELDAINASNICGLSDRNGHILINKTQNLKNSASFGRYSGCLGTNSSWNLQYEVIGVTNTTIAACPTLSPDTLQICNQATQLRVGAQTGRLQATKYELELFFPTMDKLNLVGSSITTGTKITMTNASSNLGSGSPGTYVHGSTLLVIFNLSSATGQETVTVSTNNLPITSFIKRISTPTGVQVNVTINEFTSSDFLGARLDGVVSKRGFATAKRFILLNTTVGLYPTIVRLSTWL